MPSRWQCLLIIAFWLAVTGVLYVRELEPDLRQNDPPPYVIELTAETQVETHPQVTWKVFENGQDEERYLAATWMDHREADDSFALHAKVKQAPLLADKSGLLIVHLESSYRVSREGRLLEFQVEGVLNRRPVPGLPDLGFKPEFELRGRVVGDQVVARLDLPQLKGLLLQSQTNFSFPVSHNGAIFLPLHPVNKIHGVRPGRTWRVPEVDPMGSAVRGFFRKFHIDLPDKRERILEARVRDGAVVFPYDIGDGQTHVCRVIDYREAEGEGSAATWVEIGTDLVLCQEASGSAGSLRMVRDTAGSKVR